METIFELMKEINIGQLIAIGVMFWFFYNRLDAKIEKLDVKIEKAYVKIDDSEKSLVTRIDGVEKSLAARIDKLSDKVEDIDRRLCRIEGSLSTQGHCLFHKQQEDRKAE